jgi:hypothetical protein
LSAPKVLKNATPLHSRLPNALTQKQHASSSNI